MSKNFCENCELPLPGGCHHLYGDQPECEVGRRTDTIWVIGKKVWDELCGRRGIKDELNNCEDYIKIDIIEAIGKIGVEAIAAEREACAKIADQISDTAWAVYKGRIEPCDGWQRADAETQGQSNGAAKVAARIRARSCIREQCEPAEQPKGQEK